MIKKILNRFSIELFALGIFLILLPLVLNITYIQNDEVINYATVTSFLNGDFHLNKYLLSTFYSQGLLAAVWQKSFGISTIPVLTLIVSVLSVYFFTKIVRKFFNLSLLVSFFLGLLFLVNPIFLYSSLGFMVDNYFLLFFIVSLYFFYSYTHSKSEAAIVLSIIFGVIAFFTRQVGVLIFAGYLSYFLVRKKYKLAFLNCVILYSLFFCYLKISSGVDVMHQTSPFVLSNILNIKRSFSILVMTYSYIGVLLLPLVLFLLSKVKRFSSRQKVTYIFFVILSFFAFKLFFRPEVVTYESVLRDNRVVVNYGSVEFPYFGNVYGRTGFFPDNLDGTRYHYKGFFTLFKIFQCVGLTFAILLVAYILTIVSALTLTELLSIEFILLILNLSLLLALPKIYDRYLLPIFPVFMLFVLRQLGSINFNKIKILLLGSFILMFAFLGYQYSMDFIQVNKYVATRAGDLIYKDGVNPVKVRGGNAWNVLYPNVNRDWTFIFGYKGLNDQKIGINGFEKFEEHYISFPFSMYVDPYVYLYKKVETF